MQSATVSASRRARPRVRNSEQLGRSALKTGKQLEVEHLTEVIDSQDRRVRRLHPTKEGRKEQEWISQQVSDVAETIGRNDIDLLSTLISLTRDVD